MRLKFKHLIIENFLSFGYAELDLNDRGYTLIKGVNNNPNDNATSNGSGKSSVMEAITWALTSETIRGVSKNLVNIHTEGGAKVELDFDLDGNSYKICRYKDHKEFGNNLRFFVNGEEKSGKGIRDSEKLLAEYLPGLDSQLLGSAIILGQGMPNHFMNNTPSGRKEVLETLSKSDFMINDIKNRITDRKVELSKELRAIEDGLLASESKESIYKQQLVSYNNELNNLEDPTNLLNRIAELDSKVTSLSDDKVKLEEQYSLEKQNLDDLNLKQLNISSKQNDELREVESKYSATTQQLQAEIAQTQANINSLSREIINLKNVKDTCPTCGQKLPNVHKVDTTDKEEELNKLNIALQELKNKLLVVNTDKTNELEKVKFNYKQQLLDLTNAINNQKTTTNNLYTKINSLNNEILAQNNLLSSARLKYDNFEQNKNKLLENIKNIEAEISNLSNKILYGKTDRDETQSKLDIVNKMNTIANRDFRGYLLKNIIDYLNAKAKIYCQDIFETNKISIILEGNNLNVYYDGKMFELLSGGEQRKISIILNLSLRDMLCQFSNFSSNILCLDEITDNVDDLGVTNIFNCLSKRLEGLESIFIITHKHDIASIPIDNIITVVKDSNGVSTIQ